MCREAHPNLTEISCLIREGVNVNCADEESQTPLLLLAKNCRLDEEDVFLKLEDLQITTTDYTGQRTRFRGTLQLFIQHGVYVNYKDNDGWNALLILCRYYDKENLIDIVRLLVENRIDVNCKNTYGSNALTLLCEFYRHHKLIDIVRLLVENGIDVNCKDNDGWNALLFLCRYYDKENLIDIVRLFIEKRIEVNCKTKDGRNARSILLALPTRSKGVGDIIQLLDSTK